ncbi:MAG: class I SAM-dependent methyltransferase [Anaerolineae bacterium]|nr:class I SAM-dependent methyltransferase [Anaerolineae bacterium]MCB9106699.1 class I SAM-dependent methyltransferase [Anaerolineales bacterium]
MMIFNNQKNNKRFRRIVVKLKRKCVNSLLKLGEHRSPTFLCHHEAEKLHQKYPIRDHYKYDIDSKKERAAKRFCNLSRFFHLTGVKNVVEVGAGDGRLAYLFAQNGFISHIIDIEDWRDDDVKRAKNISFNRIDPREKYGRPANTTDLVISYNSFEHVADPTLALQEMIRITRPGGYIHLEFGPLYNSPWGLHAYRTYHAPYPQFLLDKPVLQQFVVKNGIYDLGAYRQNFQYINKWALDDYRRLVSALENRVRVIKFRPKIMTDELWVIFRYLKCFWGHNLSFDELVTASLTITLQVK